jgi:putative peptide zinc metalloprotease protein
MNITEALNAALPEMPARMVAERYPRIASDMVFREHIEDGKAVFRVYVPSAEAMYKFPPQNWALIQLFDGKRNYEEIAKLYSQQTRSEYNAEQVRDFAAELEAMDFWYKTPQEKNIVLMQKSVEERRKLLKKKSRYGDLSLILFPAVNPDKFLDWVYKYTSYFIRPGSHCLRWWRSGFRPESPSRTGQRSAATPSSSTTSPTNRGET